MNYRTPEIPRCGLCRWYEPAGTRGGFCRLLNSRVNSRWTACHRGLYPFKSGSITAATPEDTMPA